MAQGDSVDAFDVPSVLVSEHSVTTSSLSNPSSSRDSEPSSAAFASASWMQMMENGEIKQLSQDRQAIRNELVERAEQWLRFQERSGKSPIVSISWVVSGFLRLGFEPTDPFLAPLIAQLCELANSNDLTVVSKESKSKESETSKSSTLSEEECGAIRNCLAVLAECDAQKSNTVRASKTTTSCERNRKKVHDERHAAAYEAENAALSQTESRAKLPGQSKFVTSATSSRASLPSSNTPSIAPSGISPIVLAMATQMNDTTLTDGAEMQTRLQRATQFLRRGWTIPTEQESRVSLAVMGTYSEKEAVTTSFAEIRTLSCWCADTIRLTLHDKRSTPLIPNEPYDTPVSVPLWIGMTGMSTVSSRSVLSLCAIASCESNMDWDRVLRANFQILSTSYVTMIQTTLRRE